MIVITISAPFGGLLADRTGRRDTVSMISLLSYALLLPLALCMPPWAVPVIFVVVGLVSGPGAGPIVTLPALILRPEARAFGMGIFYSICYGEMMAAFPSRSAIPPAE